MRIANIFGYETLNNSMIVVIKYYWVDVNDHSIFAMEFDTYIAAYQDMIINGYLINADQCRN